MIFGEDFFNSIFGKKDNKLKKAVDLGDEDNKKLDFSPVKAPKKRPDSLLQIDDLLKRERKGKESQYDSPILEDYYKKLSKQEKRLDKGKMIEFTSPLSERYYIDGDIGQKSIDERGLPIKYTDKEGKERELPNAYTSGYTGLYTKPQLHEVGRGVSNKDVDVADVPSTAIAKLRYNPKTKNLYVTFTSSEKEYLYPNVPADFVRKFMNAESKGRYANKRLKKYRVDPVEAMQIAMKSKGK